MQIIKVHNLRDYIFFLKKEARQAAIPALINCVDLVQDYFKSELTNNPPEEHLLGELYKKLGDNIGSDRLYYYVKHVGISRPQVQEFLNNQEMHQLMAILKQRRVNSAIVKIYSLLYFALKNKYQGYNYSPIQILFMIQDTFGQSFARFYRIMNNNKNF
jgi:hypothetical protein